MVHVSIVEIVNEKPIRTKRISNSLNTSVNVVPEIEEANLNKMNDVNNVETIHIDKYLIIMTSPPFAYIINVECIMYNPP